MSFLSRRITAPLLRAVYVLGGMLAIPLAHAAVVQVERGWDLFTTIPGTSALGVPLEGVPIGTFNFSYYPGDTTEDFITGPFSPPSGRLRQLGRGYEIQTVGDADTIVKRLDIGTTGFNRSADHLPLSVLDLVSNPLTGGLSPVPGNDVARIGLEMVALQIKTVDPTDFGGLLPRDFYYETLQSDRGVLEPNPDHVGNAGDPGKDNTPSETTSLSMGIMDIHDANSLVGGAFDSSLFIKFDLRRGSLTGPVVYSDEWVLRGSGEWRRQAETGARLIEWVNWMLPDDEQPGNFFDPGNGIRGDFHPIGTIDETGLYDPTPNTSILGSHSVRAALTDPLIDRENPTRIAGLPESGSLFFWFASLVGGLCGARQLMEKRRFPRIFNTH